MKNVVLFYVAGILITFGLSFLISAGLIWVVCWAFGFAWSWKLALGLWVIILLVSNAVKAHNSRT